MRPSTFLCALAGLGLAACGSDDPPTITASASPSTFAAGASTTLTIEVTNFELRAPPGTHQHELRIADGDHDHDHDHGEGVSADGGHYHVYLDSTDVNPLMMGWKTTADLAVPGEPGAHTLIVRLNDDSHRFLSPEVKAEVAITLE